MKWMIFSFMLASGLAAASFEAAAAERPSGIVTMSFDLSAHEPGADAELWIPYPVSDADQRVSEVVVRGDFTSQAVYTDATFGTPMLHVRWASGAPTRTLTFSFRVERREVARRDFPARESAWDPRDHARDLAPTRLGPIDGEIAKLARQITRGKKTVVAKARAIYDWTIENMSRDPGTRGCGEGDVCLLLTRRAGKCADIHSLVTSLARSAGVPTREVFGLRLGKNAEDDMTGGHHCWVEFLVPGYGWTPMDPADVLKAMLTEKLAPRDAKAAEYRAYYWGGIDAYRVKLSVGRDLTLNPPQPGEPLNYFMYPHARVGATTLDHLDAGRFKYSIRHTRDAPAAPTKAGPAADPALRGPRLEHVDAARFKALAEAKHGLFLDVRGPTEVARGRIHGASVVDFQAPRFERKVALIDKRRPIFVYCAVGQRSAEAAAILHALGFAEVYALSGGLLAWNAAGFPLDRGPATADATADVMDLSAFDALLARHKRVLVDFHTPWCAPCKTMAPVVDALAVDWRGRAGVVRVDVDQSEALAVRERVQGVPVFVLYEDGKERWRTSGLVSRDVLEAQLAQ